MIGVFGVLAWILFLPAEDLKIPFEPQAGILKADFYVKPPTEKIRGVLVLSPGDNGNGGEWIQKKGWRDFAEQESLLLVGVHLVSDPEELQANRGYYEAEGVSGRYLLQAIQKGGGEGKPIYLFGLSGGAHFVSRFVAKYPKLVGGFCAYSAGWWEEPIQGMPPGVIACGEYDGARYGASLLYFQKGRQLENRWCWVSLSQTDHARHEGLESFVRHFFKDLLENSSKESNIDSLTQKEQWKDNDTFQSGDSSNILCSWFPSSSVSLLWQRLHGVKSSRSKN